MGSAPVQVAEERSRRQSVVSIDRLDAASDATLDAARARQSGCVTAYGHKSSLAWSDFWGLCGRAPGPTGARSRLAAVHAIFTTLAMAQRTKHATVDLGRAAPQ